MALQMVTTCFPIDFIHYLFISKVYSIVLIQFQSSDEDIFSLSRNSYLIKSKK
jgi:hypothetical protein